MTTPNKRDESLFSYGEDRRKIDPRLPSIMVDIAQTTFPVRLEPVTRVV
jgi:hypothetical protein